MATVHHIPTRAEIRRVLVAAADVLFSDGVPGEFLDQWVDETQFLLSLEASDRTTPGRSV